MTGNRANDTPVQPQSERINDFGAKPSQAMGTADREPAGGEIPVDLVVNLIEKHIEGRF